MTILRIIITLVVGSISGVAAVKLYSRRVKHGSAGNMRNDQPGTEGHTK